MLETRKNKNETGQPWNIVVCIYHQVIRTDIAKIRVKLTCYFSRLINNQC